MRKRTTWNTVVLVVVATASLAGCASGPFAPEPPAPLFALAGPQSGFVSVGPTYDGQGVRPLVAGVLMNVTAAEDAGEVLVAGTTDTGRRFAILADEWNATEPYHDGGVTSDARLHGDTGHDGAFLPRLEASYAAWSERAVVFVEDVPYPNPAPGRVFWDLEALYVPAGLHDPDTGAIRTADGAPYDPARPGTAAPTGRAEILVVLSSGAPVNETPMSIPVFFPAGEAVPFTDAGYRAEHPFANPAWGAEGVFQVEVTSDAGSLAATDLTFSLTAPSGRILNSTRLGGEQAASAHATMRAPMDQLGVYAIVVEGQAAAARYGVDAVFSSPEPIRIVLWWDDVSTDREAQQRAKQWDRLLEYQAASNPPREPGDPVPNRVASSQPPGLNLVVVAITVVVTLLAGLVVVKLAMDNLKGRRFDETFRRK